MRDHPAWTVSSPSAKVTEVLGLTLLTLRLHGADDVVATVSRALGVAIPAEPNTVAGDAIRALWLAPDEWLLVSENVVDIDAMNANLAALGILYHLSDASDGFVVIDISGKGAQDVLANGCSLDLHPCVFGAGRCARSLLTSIPMLIERQEPSPQFRLYADASHGWYLRSWFEDIVQSPGEFS